jgi:uncharacterized protein YceK
MSSTQQPSKERKKLVPDTRGNIGGVVAVVAILAGVMLVMGISSVIMAKMAPHFSGSDTRSNETMDLIKSRGWSAIDLAGYGIPIFAVLGFIAFMILWGKYGS